ncbi:MAG: rhodanese-like domain-containing protein [Mucilaginibacter sp.]
MKNNIITLSFCLFISLLLVSVAKAQTSPGSVPATLNTYPWSNSELMAPSALVTIIKNTPASLPLVLNIGAVEDIKGATHIGAVSNADNLKALAKAVSTLPKNKAIVIYCGCCPFTRCPNIKPAFNELKKLGFTNVKLLNLPVNLKTNWIAEGYPLAGS